MCRCLRCPRPICDTSESTQITQSTTAGWAGWAGWAGCLCERMATQADQVEKVPGTGSKRFQKAPKGFKRFEMFTANQSKDVWNMNIFLNVRTLICLSTAFFSNEHIQHFSAHLRASQRLWDLSTHIKPHQPTLAKTVADALVLVRIAKAPGMDSGWFRMQVHRMMQDDAGCKMIQVVESLHCGYHFGILWSFSPMLPPISQNRRSNKDGRTERFGITWCWRSSYGAS